MSDCCHVDPVGGQRQPEPTVLLNLLVQSVEVHVPSVSKRCSTRAGGRRVRSGLTRGTFARKEDKLLRNRSSARSLSTPAIWANDRVNECSASMKKRQRSKCISSGFLLCLSVTMCMMASSQWPLTCVPDHSLPQTAADSTTASISLKAIPRPVGHSICHHFC